MGHHESIITTVISAVIAIIGGMLLPLQAGLNVKLSTILNDNPLRTAFVSFTVGAIYLFLCLLKSKSFSLISIYKILKHVTSSFMANKFELIVFFNGVIGAIWGSMPIFLSPIIGFALYFMCIVCGQILFSIIVDLYPKLLWQNQFNQTQTQKPNNKETIPNSSTTDLKIPTPSSALSSNDIDTSDIAIDTDDSTNSNSNSNSNSNEKEKEKPKLSRYTIGSVVCIFVGVTIFQLNDLINNNNGLEWYYYVIYSIIAIFVGVISVIRTGFTRRIKYYSESSLFATTIDFINTMTVLFIINLIIFLVVYVPKDDKSIIDKENEKDNQWYFWLGGVAGSSYVLVTIVVPCHIGFVATFICTIFGNFLISIIFDTVGAFGVTPQKLTWNRIVGALFVFSSVLLVNIDKILKQRKQHNEKKKQNHVSRESETNSAETVRLQQSPRA